jgi:hypothetical protein
MEEQPKKRSWYFEDDLTDRSAIVYPHPTPVPAVRLKVRRGNMGFRPGDRGRAVRCGRGSTPSAHAPLMTHRNLAQVGFSRTAIFPFPDGVRAFCVKPTLLYLYGLRKEEVDEVAQAIRSVRKPNVYTGNGIQLVDEVVRQKQRKASK